MSRRCKRAGEAERRMVFFAALRMPVSAVFENLEAGAMIEG